MNFLTKVNLNKNIEGSEQFCKFDFDPVPEVIEKHLKLSGWVVGIESPVVGIELIQDGQLLWESPLTINRSLVYQTDKTVTGEQQCGFSINLALENINLASPVILIQAVFEDFKRIPLADLNLSIAEESNHDLAQVQAELHNTREELERLQSQFDEVLAELEQTHWQLHQVQTKQSDSDVTIDSDKQVIEVNPEDIQSYYRFLEVQPENSDIWLQLANILVEQNRLEDAIAVYRRLVELSPCEEYYQKLGELLVKQEKWDEAIIVYKRAIEFNPESYLYYYQLGEVIYNRVMQNPESFFVDYKIAELPHKDYQIFDPEPPDICFLNDEQFLQVTCNLDEEAYVSEVYRVYFKREASDIEIIGGCQWLRQGNSRLQGLKQGRNLPEFTTLLSRSITSVCLQSAVNYYQRAIELNHNFYESYFRLGEVLSQQGKINEANATYYKTATQLAEKNDIDTAISLFKKIPKLYSETQVESAYDYLWKGLNLLNHLNTSSPHCQVEVKQEEVHSHFINKSQYKVITLDALTAEDKDFLKENGLMISNLDLIRQDNAALEKIYINSCALSQEKIDVSQKLIKPDYFQQTIVETGYVYAVDPFSGQIIRSNQSFYYVAWLPMFMYRFVGSEVFYLVAGHHWNGKIFLYFPRLELIIKFYPGELHLVNYEGIINHFKSYMVSYWQDVQKYISTPEKKVASVLGVLNQIGHYLWNDLTGIQYLYENEILQKPDIFLVGASNFLDIGDIFPEIPADKIKRFNNNLNIFEAILQNNYMVVRVTDKWFTNELEDRLYKNSLTRCSESFLQDFDKAKQHFPLLCIQIRNYRTWISQISGIANIIRELHNNFPNLGIVFDGWSRLENEDQMAEETINKEKQIVEKILEELPENIGIYNIIGSRIYEKIVWHKIIDAFVASMGSGVLFLTSIANKPGVIHGNRFFIQPHHQEELKRWRKDLLMPIFISPEHIMDDESDPDYILRNYDCDWKVIYEAILTLLKELNLDQQ